MAPPDWRRLVDHVQAVPERIYETWTSRDGWDNDTQFGRQYGENLVSWCVIFNWDMYADVGLQSIVPKTDNVNVFAAWAKARGQWSEYPSIGAWADFGDGAHTEIVVGFDATYVYTKGGNSVKAGSTDSGQGNGVWSHRTERRSSRVTGYLAPRYADSVCPPTADPHDPRGGPAITAWRWTGPATPTPSTPHTQEDDVSAMDVLTYRNKAADDASVKAGKGHIPDFYGYVVGTNRAVSALTAQVAALTATVAQLAKGTGGLTAAQITAAAKAGASAALAELGDALSKGD